MPLGQFHCIPHEGHLEHLKCAVGHLCECPHGAVCFHTNIPGFEAQFENDPAWHDWVETACSSPPKEVDPWAPVPEGKPAHAGSFVDANLMHDAVVERPASSVLEVLSQTPDDWLSKHQNQAEAATCGSEFVVARIGCERLIDLRCALRSFGVPLDGPSWMFGDNKSVVTSSAIPHSGLSEPFWPLCLVREGLAIT